MSDWKLNPSFVADAPVPGAPEPFITPRAVDAAFRDVSRFPGYMPSPIKNLRAFAKRFGVGSVWYKDESGRFGLGSFKAIGAGYGVLQAVRQFAGVSGIPSSLDKGGPASRTETELVRELTIACATDGNHGRAVAWACSLFGCDCVIYLHEGVSRHREQAICALGARVLRKGRTYDESVESVRADSERLGWCVVSDTSYLGYTDIPLRIMEGYAILGREAEIQGMALPTHIFIQAGVGGLAAALCAYYWHRYQARRPKMVVAEPVTAACFYSGAGSTSLSPSSGDLKTIMAGLACGRPSLVAKQILTPGAYAFVTVSDDAVPELVRALASPASNDPPIVAGESAVAGLAALDVVRNDEKAAHALNLNSESRILVIGTEGATDPEIHRRILKGEI